MLRLFPKLFSFTLVLALICIGISAVILLLQRSAAERQIEHQLLTIDAHFTTPQTVIPASILDEALFPAQVGSFKRVDLSRSIKSDCGWNVGKIQVCLTAAYALNQQYPQLWLKAGETNSLAIENRVGSMLCSATVTGELRLRTQSQHPYLYLVCLPQFQAPSSIYGLSWHNGKWFIGLFGDYDLISQFLAAYPY